MDEEYDFDEVFHWNYGHSADEDIMNQSQEDYENDEW
jgi:hypothetical protein